MGVNKQLCNLTQQKKLIQTLGSELLRHCLRLLTSLKSKLELNRQEKKSSAVHAQRASFSVINESSLTGNQLFMPAKVQATLLLLLLPKLDFHPRLLHSLSI